MSKKYDLKGITRTELVELIEENQVDSKWVINGIEFSIRGSSNEIDLVYGKTKAFLLSHGNDMGSWYIYSSYHLKDAQDHIDSMHYLSEIFGVDLVSGETISHDDTPVFDDRDVTIARLEAQISVYKSMMPSVDYVTYGKREAIHSISDRLE